VYPPVDTAFYRPPDGPHVGGRKSNPGFLVVSALVPYKRVDIAIEACRMAGAKLTIVGRGPEEARLKALAGPGVEFLGWLSDEQIRDCYRRTAGVLLPGVEDFGMVPVEAQACGAPVVAFGTGGACETVRDGVTGVLVQDGSPQAFAEGLLRVTSLELDPSAIRANAERFSRERFMTDFQAATSDAIADRDRSR
jgi:glycosyltransferase involved in cell wall biosynthesis